MSGVTKFSISLLASIVVFSVLAVLVSLDQLEFLETRFYIPRVEQSISSRADRAAELVDSFHERNIDWFREFALSPSVVATFRINASEELLLARQQALDALELELTSLDQVRIIDLTADQLQYSSDPEDFEGSASRREYFRPEVVSQRLSIPLSELAEFDSIGEDDVLPRGENLPEVEVVLDEVSNQFIYRVPAVDANGFMQGTALFYVNTRDLRTRLVRNAVIGTLDEIRLVRRGGIIINAPVQFAESIAEAVTTNWDTIRSDGDRVTVGSSEPGSPAPFRYEVFEAATATDDLVIYLEPSSSLEMPLALQYTLVGAIFLTTFLVVFLVLNIRQDAVVVLEDRVKRFQVNFLREFMEDRREVDFDRWRAELEERREDVDREIRRGIGKVPAEEQARVDELIDRTWDDIIGVLSGRAQEGSGRTLGEDEIERIIDGVARVMKTTPLTVSAARVVSAPESASHTQAAETVSSSDDLEPLEEAEVVEDADEVGELDEVDELDDLEDADDVESADEQEFTPLSEEEIARRKAEYLQRKAEDSGVVQTVSEVEDVDELEDAEDIEPAEDLDEVEAVEEAEELDEDEPLTPLTEEEIVRRRAEYARTQAPPATENDGLDETNHEEVSSVEGVDTAEEFTEIESAEEVEEIDAPESLEPVDLVEDVEEVEDIDEVDGVEEVGEEIHELDDEAAAAETGAILPEGIEDVSFDTLDERAELEWLAASQVNGLPAASSSSVITSRANVPQEPDVSGEEPEELAIIDEDESELDELEPIEDRIDGSADQEAEDFEELEPEELEPEELEPEELEPEELEPEELEPEELEADELPELALESDELEELESSDETSEELFEELQPVQDEGEPTLPEELESERVVATTFGAGFFGFGRGTTVSLTRQTWRGSAGAGGEQQHGGPDTGDDTSQTAGNLPDELDEVAEMESVDEVEELTAHSGATGRGGGLVRISHDRSVVTPDYEIASLSEVLNRLHVSRSIIEENDGVVQIDREAYGTSTAGTDATVKSLVAEVTGGVDTTGSAGIESLFGGGEDDLLSDFGIDDDETDKQIIHQGVSLFRFNDSGFDYDAFLSGFRNNEGGRLKSLVRFTRFWGARVGIVLSDDELGYSPMLSIGVEGDCRDRFRVSKSSEVSRNVFEKGRVLFISRPLREVEYFHDLCSVQHLAPFERTLFVPITIDRRPAYFCLGLDESTRSIDDAFTTILPLIQTRNVAVGQY